MRTLRALTPLIAAAGLLISCASASPAADAGQAGRACVQARIGGHVQCLIAGHPCKPRYEKQYERHGFKCKRNTAGQYRLWKPVKPGQPRP